MRLNKAGAAKALLLLVMLTLFILDCSAQNKELSDAVDKYFKAIEEQNVNAFLDAIIVPEDDLLTKDAVKMLFEKYPQKDISWEFVDETFYNKGNSANMVFDVRGTIVEAETGKEMHVKDRFIALFEKQSGKWKIWRIMPLADFTHQLKAYYDMIETVTRETQEEWDKLDAKAREKKEENQFKPIGFITIAAIVITIIAVLLFINAKKAKHQIN